MVCCSFFSFFLQTKSVVIQISMKCSSEVNMSQYWYQIILDNYVGKEKCQYVLQVMHESIFFLKDLSSIWASKQNSKWAFYDNNIIEQGMASLLFCFIMFFFVCFLVEGLFLYIFSFLWTLELAVTFHKVLKW